METYTRVLNDVISTFNSEYSDSIPLSPVRFQLHVTTDDRKTNRKIPLYIQKQNAEIEEHSIGKDERYLVIGILGKDNLSKKATRHLMRLFAQTFTKYASDEFIEIPFSDDYEKYPSQLGLFNA